MSCFREIFLFFFLGVFIILCANVAVGKVPVTLKLAIVNHGIDDRFIQEFLDHIQGVEKISYDSQETAVVDFSKGRVFGILELSDNFSKILFNSIDLNEELSHFAAAVSLDNSKYLFSTFVQHKIMVALDQFLANKSTDFDISGHLLLKPIRIEQLDVMKRIGEMISELIIFALMLSTLGKKFKLFY
jgi:hypothetical protein